MESESWFDTFPWFDNLDILGSDAYLSFPGPYIESMDSSWRLKALEIVQSYDVPDVAFHAHGYELVGYSFAAQAMRDRATALITFLDAHMWERHKDAVRDLLQYEKRPQALIEAARHWEAKGFPLAGNALRERAALLRLARRPRTPAPEIVWPWS